MTAEDVDLDMSIAFEKLALSPQQHTFKNNDHEQIIFKAINEIRAKKKRPDTNSIFDYITNNLATNIDKDFVKNLIDELIKKDKIFNKQTCKGQNSLFVNTEVEIFRPTANSQIITKTPNKKATSLIDSVTTTPKCDSATETPLIKEKENVEISQKNNQRDILAETHRPIYSSKEFVRNDIFDTFYEDYLEFKDYINDVIKTITPNPVLVTDLSNENTSLTTKIAMLEKEIKTLKMKTVI